MADVTRLHCDNCDLLRGDEMVNVLAMAARGELPTCTRRDCPRLATKRCETEAGEFDACDECARVEGRDFHDPHSSGWQDLPHAAALRAAMEVTR